MRLPLPIIILAALALCGTASGQLAKVPNASWAEVKLSAETSERFNSVKSRIESMNHTGNFQRARTELRLAIDDPSNTPDARSMLLIYSGQVAQISRDPGQAVAFYQQALTVSGTTPDVKALALRSLISLRMEQHRTKEVIDALDAILQIPGLHPDSRVVAMFIRADLYQSMQKSEDAYAGLTAAFAESDASPRHRAIALLRRSIIPAGEPHWEKDIAQAMAMPDIPAELRSTALVMRASFYRADRQKERSLADCQTILSTPGTPANDRAAALAIIAEDQLTRYEFDAALKGLDEALALHDLQPDTQALAYLTRSKMRTAQNDYPRAYADLRLAERTEKISPTMLQQIRQQKLLMDGQ